MSIITKGLFIGLLLSAFYNTAAYAATHTSRSCSQTDVQATINSAVAGDTVNVPAGTCSWSGGLSISGIKLIGSGKSTSGTIITAGAVTITKHATQHTRLSGVRFTGTSNHVIFRGSASTKPFIIDNCYFFTNGGSDSNRMMIGLANGGVLHHNEFTAAVGTGADVFNIATGETDWSQPTTIGSEDTSGERNLYFEDNTFTNILETGPDADTGTRLVMRYNTFVDSSIVLHSSAPNDSGPVGGGHRHTEIYNNVFRRVSNSFPINKWIWVRGGTGVFANNTLDRADSPDGYSYAGKSEIRFSVGCPSAYPITYQVGQVTIPADPTPNRPFAVFGNKGTGATDSNFIGISSGPMITCGNPAAYIQQGRDYVLSNTWGWTPYTYPHPLASGAPTAPPPEAPAPLPTGTLPSGNTGIAALYAGDANIQSHPDVLFADNFESYSSASQLANNWNQVYQQSYTRIATETQNVFSGTRALEFRVPQQSAEVANAVIKNISPTEDTVFVRVYTKFEAGYNAGTGSTHNGIAIKSRYCCAGVPANGTNKFYVDLENTRQGSSSDPTPGYTAIYIYHPDQRSQWGDLWYPNGTVLPFSSTPGDFGPTFIPRPNFLPQLNRWYSYELMVKANTPGQRDGRIAVWIDGNLIADFPNVQLRDVSSLKIDQVELGLHIGSNTIRQNIKWYDDVVVARSYIGPKSPGGAVPIAPPTNLSAIVQ